MSEYHNEREAQFLHDPLIKKAQLGIEAQTFIESNLGRYVVERAERQIDEANMSLSQADPFDPAQIAHLQNKIAVARAAVQWIAEAVNEGYAAERTIEAQEAID
jgi:hypothetical protein